VVRGARAAAAVLLAAGLAGACGDDDGSGEGATDTTSARSADTTIASTTTTLDPEAEVEAAYLAYWEMQRRLGQAPDPMDDEISRRATGPARDKLIDSLATMQATGETLEFGPRYSHTVTSVETDGVEATVRDCAVDDGARVDATGEVHDLELSTSLLEATLVRRDSGWLIESISERRSWVGVTPCGR
jgi:hypothetical protein